MATTPAVHVARDRFHLAWDPAIPAIETVESGSTVEFDLLDASGGQLIGRLDRTSIWADSTSTLSTRSTVRSQSRAREPGDTLQIDLLEFEPADWGWTANIPGFGLLADQFPDPYLRITKVPRPGERAEFLPGVRVPIVAVLRRDRGRSDRWATIDDPTRSPRREHGHAPPDGRLDAVPAGLP